MNNKTPNNLLEGLNIASFESRLALKMEKMIQRHGGTSFSAPTIKECPLQDHQSIISFYQKLQSGLLDYVVFLTGIGARTFIDILSEHFPKEEILQTLRDKTQIVVRGPKPKKVCHLLKLPIYKEAPAPNTWEELTTLFNDEILKGKHIGIIEYGESNSELISFFEDQQAAVYSVQVYTWQLPDDITPLKNTIKAICEGQLDVLLFTSAVQAVHLLEVAQDMQLEGPLRKQIQKAVIFSIGPVASKRLHQLQLFPDVEVFPNTIEELIHQTSLQSARLSQSKKKSVELKWVQVDTPFKKEEELKWLRNSPILKATRLEANKKVPVWLMRQAGRYMAEYQMIRKRGGFKDLLKNPDLAAEATLTALERLGVDAAIIFSDILVVLEAMGQNLEYHEGIGPILTPSIQNLSDIDQILSTPSDNALDYVYQAISKVRKRMHPRIPLIGFAGAPFTLACYAIEGKSSKDFKKTQTLMDDEIHWHRLMNKLSDAIIPFLHEQIKAGCQIVQLFDSWVGCLSPERFQKFVLPYTQKIIQSIPQEIAVINFGLFNEDCLDLQKQCGGIIQGVSHHFDIEKVWNNWGNDVGVQGNLDPGILFEPIGTIKAKASKILHKVGHKKGFIFNLGHGIQPKTPVDHVMALVDHVHEFKVSD